MDSHNVESNMPLEAGQEKVEIPEQLPRTMVEAGQRNPELDRRGEGDATKAPTTPLPAVDPGSLAVPSQTGAASFTQADNPPGATSQAVTNDNDDNEFEQEWVDRAKNIILRTRDDPHTQKNELSKIKAEYIERRFSKKIKLADDSLKA